MQSYEGKAKQLHLTTELQHWTNYNAGHSSLTKHDDKGRDVSWCQAQGTNALPMSEIQVDQVQRYQFPVTANTAN